VRISAEDLTDGKPNPEIFLKAAAALGSDPADCLVIEDACQRHRRRQGRRHGLYRLYQRPGGLRGLQPGRCHHGRPRRSCGR